jgi:hypothetical protein
MEALLGVLNERLEVAPNPVSQAVGRHVIWKDPIVLLDDTIDLGDQLVVEESLIRGLVLGAGETVVLGHVGQQNAFERRKVIPLKGHV